MKILKNVKLNAVLIPLIFILSGLINMVLTSYTGTPLYAYGKIITLGISCIFIFISVINTIEMYSKYKNNLNLKNIFLLLLSASPFLYMVLMFLLIFLQYL